MLIEFCGGHIDPERVEAVMPSARGGYMLVTKGRNIVGFDTDPDTLGEALVNAGLVEVKSDAAT